jgi:hypothetical protein
MSGSGARTISPGGGGGDAQPASASSIATRTAAGVDDNGRTGFAIRRREVGWVFLEIVAVLAIAIAIVWWTLPKKPKKPKDGTGSRAKPPPDDGQD